MAAASGFALPKVLMVDDDPEIISALSDTLGLSVAFERLDAANGIEALAILKSHPLISLVTTDLRMPGGNGEDFIVGARACGIQVPVIVVSASIDVETRRRLAPHVPIAFVDKIESSELLIKRAEEVLSERICMTGELSRHLTALAETMDQTKRLREELSEELERLRAKRPKRKP